MAQTRRSKRVILTEKIIQQITTGNLLPGSEFPSIKELSQKYQISDRTACSIIQELAQKGFLDLAQGRRSLVRSTYAATLPPQFTKPIGILCPEPELLRNSRWRAWLVQHLQKRLEADGAQALCVLNHFITPDVMATCSGFIVASEMLSNDRWALLQSTGLPCVQLTFHRPYPNTIFIDYRAAMDEVALFLAERQCNKVVMLGTCEWSSKDGFTWFGQIGFLQLLQNYRIDQKGLFRIVVSHDDTSWLEEVKELVVQQSAKIAFLTFNASYNPMVIDAMKSCRCTYGIDYEIVSLGHAPGEQQPGYAIDLKCEEVAEEMLKLLYRHQVTGEVQRGRIVHAKFMGNVKY